ncbi:MAG: mechanosensitive ion channel domain-containing protein [Desulfobaccales bacterium]|jgi:small-conductance mechanosensitive channel
MEELLGRWLVDPTVDKLLLILGVLVVARLAVYLLNRYLARDIQDPQTRYLVHKFLSLAGYATVILFLAILFRNVLSGLVVGLGVAGAGAAFVFQEVLVNCAGWLAISFSRLYAPGDRIQVGTIRGDVIDISALRTTLMECGVWVEADLFTGRIVRIPNSSIFKEPVINYSADFPFLWDEITVPVKHGDDYQLARRILEDVINEIVGDYVGHAKKAWKDAVKKYFIDASLIDSAVTMVFTDNWIEFKVRYIVDYKKRRSIKDRIFSRILEEFAKTQGRVTIASGTFQLVDPPVFQVQVSSSSPPGQKGSNL